MTTPAVSVVRYCNFFRFIDVRTVLDYGAGTLRNSLYLSGQGFTVYAADLHEQVKALQSHPEVHRLAGLLDVRELEHTRLCVDAVLSTYVFNIITRKTMRRRYLENIVGNLRAGGYLLMELVCSPRYQTAGDAAWDRYFTCNASVKTFTHQQLDRVLAPYGFTRICHYYTSHALAALYRLERPSSG